MKSMVQDYRQKFTKGSYETYRKAVISLTKLGEECEHCLLHEVHLKEDHQADAPQFALFNSNGSRSLRGTLSTSGSFHNAMQWLLTAVFPNALHHTGRNRTEDKLFTVSPMILDYVENGLLKSKEIQAVFLRYVL
jgi:hypothetical protein